MILLPILLSISVSLLVVFILLYFSSLRRYQNLEDQYQSREEQLSRKFYETSILEEISSRIGYSLNVEKIAEIITGSLPSLISYSTASYILISPDKLIFRSFVHETVSSKFVTEVKRRMLESVVALSSDDLSKKPIEEGVYGILTSEDSLNVVGSFFNIPLVINGKLSGLINVSSQNTGLYQEEDMTVLYKIVNKASSAVEKLDEVLKSEKGKLAVMIESLSDGVVMVDSSLGLAIINPAGRGLLNLKEGDISFYDVQESLEHSFDGLGETVLSVIKEDKVVNGGNFSLGGRYLEVLISPVKSSQGMLGAVLVIHDRTHEKSLERLREEFTAMVVHELRTPLSVMFGTCDLLIKRLSQLPVEKTSALLLGVKNSTESMLGIVNSLLDVAKIEAGKFSVDKVPGNIGELLLEEKQYFDNLAQSKGLIIKLDIPKDIPEVNFDKQRLSQVLNNLISNSLKFTEKGGITLKAAKNGGDIVVGVSDTGPGISKEGQLKLFSKFEQLKNHTGSVTKGTGLGLVITKGIVEAHGGNVLVESEVGKGTTFYFNLPLT